MKTKHLIWSLLFALMASISLVSCDDDDDMTDDSDLNAVEFLENNDDYSMLATALVRANLVDALDDPGEQTIFAPDNAAFNSFLSTNGYSTVEEIPENILADVLLYHVLPSQFLSADLTNNYFSTQSPSGYNGANLSMYINIDNGFFINDQAEILPDAVDMEVSNGVIHGVDEVLVRPNIVTFANADPSLESFTRYLTASQLPSNIVSTLQGDGPFTVFAPNNVAFGELINENTEWDQLADIPGDRLEAILLFHVSDTDNLESGELMNGMQIQTLSGQSLDVTTSDGNATITGPQNSADINFVDIQTTNGVIHMIDEVLIPGE